MFKAQILAELTKQYPGLPKQFLGTLAATMAGKVTDETTIEGVVTALNTGVITINDLAADWQKEGDRRATEAVNTHKAKYPVPNDPPKPPTDPIIPPVAETAFEKQLREMSEKLAAMEQKETHQSTMTTLLGKMKDKKLPALLADNLTLAADTDLDALVTAMEGKWNAHKQSETTENLRGNSFIPGGGGVTGGVPSTQAADAIKKFTAAQSAEAAKKTTV